MAGWTSLKWLFWIGLYLLPVVFLPLAISRSWGQQHGHPQKFRLKELFERGELGLLSLVLASSVVWNLLQSQFVPHTIALASMTVAVLGIMSLTVWVETYRRRQSGSDWRPQRAWRDSRNLALLTLSMAGVMQILLDRLSKVVTP